MKKITKEIGKRIAAIRIEKGFSQEKLGIIARLNKNYIGSIERGEYNVTLVTLQKIAKALDVKISDLLKDF